MPYLIIFAFLIHAFAFFVLLLLHRSFRMRALRKATWVFLAIILIAALWPAFIAILMMITAGASTGGGIILVLGSPIVISWVGLAILLWNVFPIVFEDKANIMSQQLVTPTPLKLLLQAITAVALIAFGIAFAGLIIFVSVKVLQISR